MHQMFLSCKMVALMILVLSVALINGQDSAGSSPDQSTPCPGDACASINPVTTVAPSTVVPSTAAPSTVVPSTAAPSTVVPSTAAPTTVPAKITKLFKPRTTRRPISSEDYDNSEDDSETEDESEESGLESLSVWITFVDPWEVDNKSNNKGNKGGNSRDKNKGKKPATTQVHFPVRHYPDYRQFPMQHFSSLISIVPWLPIYYDRTTFQTIIFSPSGGIYIMPPLINFYGQRFSVAQLIGWGYASLLSNGASPTPNMDISRLVQPTPPATGSDIQYDKNKDVFTGGVKTQFGKFKPRYSSTLYEAANS